MSDDAFSRSQEEIMRIGIIGAGMIGSTLAKLWADGGHEILISSRHPDKLQSLVDELGPRTRAGPPPIGWASTPARSCATCWATRTTASRS